MEMPSACPAWFAELELPTGNCPATEKQEWIQWALWLFEEGWGPAEESNRGSMAQITEKEGLGTQAGTNIQGEEEAERGAHEEARRQSGQEGSAAHEAQEECHRLNGS